jgi:hypothetical protein
VLWKAQHVQQVPGVAAALVSLLVCFQLFHL